MAGRKSKTYMTDEEFAELMESAKQAGEFERGIRTDCRVTIVAAPPPPKQRTSRQIVAIRKRLKLSQDMFAQALNVTRKTVQAWEYGQRAPSEASLKLLAIAEKHPEALVDSV